MRTCTYKCLWECFHMSCQCPLFQRVSKATIHIRTRVRAHSSPPPFFSFLSHPELLSWPDSAANLWPCMFKEGGRVGVTGGGTVSSHGVSVYFCQASVSQIRSSSDRITQCGLRLERLMKSLLKFIVSKLNGPMMDPSKIKVVD